MHIICLLDKNLEIKTQVLALANEFISVRSETEVDLSNM